MSLRDFVTAHRQQLLEACESELHAGATVPHLVSQFAEGLSELLGTSSNPEPKSGSAALLGKHPTVVRARKLIEQMAQRPRSPVLILGEEGTGREHWAAALHQATYPEGELIQLAGAEGLGELRRRLDRLRKRTSADAVAGLTVYVRAIDSTSPQVQAEAIKLLGERQLQFRLVACATRSLTEACRAGELRSDLVFEFPNVTELAPLRTRASDVAELVQHLAERFAARASSAPLRFEPGALQALESHPWPGNLDELQRLIERLDRECAGRAVTEKQIAKLGEPSPAITFVLPPSGIDLEQLERELLIQALTLSKNNQSHAARLLGLSRDQIRYRLTKLDLLRSNQRG